jgi:hypothetical protein
MKVVENEEEYKRHMNKLIVCDQNIGVIRYVGPIKDLSGMSYLI